MRAGRMVSIAGADASPGAGRKTRAACGSASWSIIEFSNPDTNTKAEHYWHRRETRGEVRSEGGRQDDLPTR